MWLLVAVTPGDPCVRNSSQTLAKFVRLQVVSRVGQRKRRSQRAALKKNDDKLPQVGIIFLVDSRLLIETTPTADGERYGDYINHARGHDVFWAELQSQAQAPPDEDYMSAPRGRVVFCSRTGQYFLFLDRCILGRPDLVREIKLRMNLPERTQTSADAHYRCPICLSRNSF